MAGAALVDAPVWRQSRKRAPALQLRIAAVHVDGLLVALEYAGARVSDGRWIEPLHHRAWPRNPNNRKEG